MYKYLGLMFNDQLSIEQIVAWRAQRVLKKTLIPMRKMLGKKQIPLNLRRQAIIPPLLPALAYGGELFGLMELRASGKSLYAPLSSARDDPETRAGHDGVRVVQHHQEQADRYH